MKKYLRNEQGATLVLTIFLTVFISIIGISLITMNTNSMKLSKIEQEDQTVYYVAEAGINFYIEEVRKKMAEAFLKTQTEYNSLDLDSKVTFDFERRFKEITKNEILANLATHKNLSFDNDFLNRIKNAWEFDEFYSNRSSSKVATVEIVFEEKNGKDIVHFQSIGTIEGERSRTLKQSMELIYDLVTTANTEIIRDTNSNGDIVQENGELDDFLTPYNPNNPSKTAIYLGNAADADKIKGNFKHEIGTFNPIYAKDILPTEAQFNKVFSNLENNKDKMNYHKFDKEADTNYTLTGSTYVDNSERQNIDQDTNITIMPVERPTNIYFSNNMNINDNGSGKGNKVEGTGVLTINVEGSTGDEVNIIVNGDMVSNNKFTISANPGVKVNLIVKGNVNFNANGNNQNISLDANIIALNSNLITASKTKIDIKGTFITTSSSQTQPQGSNQSSFGGICAPNSQIGLNGTINLTGGIVVAGIAYINGGGSFDYTPTNLSNPCQLPSIVNGTIEEREVTYYSYELPDNSTNIKPSIEQ